jgi:hypothetical protein
MALYLSSGAPQHIKVQAPNLKVSGAKDGKAEI